MIDLLAVVVNCLLGNQQSKRCICLESALTACGYAAETEGTMSEALRAFTQTGLALIGVSPAEVPLVRTILGAGRDYPFSCAGSEVQNFSQGFERPTVRPTDVARSVLRSYVAPSPRRKLWQRVVPVAPLFMTAIGDIFVVSSEIRRVPTLRSSRKTLQFVLHVFAEARRLRPLSRRTPKFDVR